MVTIQRQSNSHPLHPFVSPSRHLLCFSYSIWRFHPSGQKPAQGHGV